MLKNDSELKIEVNDLVKIYKRGNIEVVALRGLNASFNEGEIVVIEGPSGCGKTTLVNLIAGLDKPDAGQILISNHDSSEEVKGGSNDKVDITKLSNKDLEIFRRKRVGVVFQFMNLVPTLTAEENILLPLVFEGVPARKRKKISKNLLRLTQMTERSGHKPGQLSGGEQQRIAIAAALANDPDIIIADEPTGELDSESRENILDIFKDLIEEYPNKCLIIVTHDRAIERVADRVLTINDGVIVNEYIPGIVSDGKEVPQEISNELSKYRKNFSVIKRKLSDLTDAIKELENE